MRLACGTQPTASVSLAASPTSRRPRRPTPPSVSVSASATVDAAPAKPAPPPFPLVPLPCPELASVWGHEPAGMSLGCARYHLYPDECNNRYRLHNAGSRSACVHQANGCVEEAAQHSCPPAPPSAPEPPSPPFVQVVHPATASTQIVLADTFQTAPPGRRTYRPLQYLTQNGYPETPGANVTNAMIDANIVLCAQGECTKLICATSCDESIENQPRVQIHHGCPACSV